MAKPPYYRIFLKEGSNTYLLCRLWQQKSDESLMLQMQPSKSGETGMVGKIEITGDTVEVNYDEINTPADIEHTTIHASGLSHTKMKDGTLSINYDKDHAGKLEFHQDQINATNASITTLQKELDDLRQALPTREEFVELIHSYLETILNTHDLVEEDAVYRELVLNLRANDNSVSVIKLNPPYDMTVDLSKNTSWSRNDDLMQTYLDTLHQLLLNSKLMSKNLLRASECVGNNPEATSMNRFLL